MKTKITDFTGWEKMEESDLILSTSVFDIEKQRMKCLRTGKEGDFYTFTCNDWINVIALTAENKLVMIRQFRAGSDKIELEIPGGGIDKQDSDPVVAGARELLEETGYSGENGTIIGYVCPNPALQGNTCYTVLFENTKKVSEPTMEGTEDIETILVPLEEIDAKIRNGEVTHGLVLNALHFMEKKLML